MSAGVLAALVVALQAAAVAVPHLVAVATHGEHYENTGWCAFDSVTTASARAEEAQSLTVVNAWTARGKLVHLKVEWASPSGDWRVRDSYDFEGPKVLSVAREVSWTADDEKLSQTFTRQGEGLVLSRTNQVHHVHPREAPYADLAAAPFYDLLVRAAAAGKLPEGGLCIVGPRQGGR